MTAQIANVVVHVGDMDRALHFYRDGLGLDVRFDGGERIDPTMLALSGTDSATAMHLVVLDLDGTAGLALTSFGRAAPAAVPFEQAGQVHVGLRVDDVRATLERAVAAGGTVLGSPGIVGRPGQRARLAFLHDPDGTVVELVENLVEEVEQR